MEQSRATIRYRTGVILLIVGVLLASLLVRMPTQGAATAPATPCLSQVAGGFVFALAGYEANGDGSYTLIWQVTNTGKHDISYVAFGTGSWTRAAPEPGSIHTGELGDYQVEWTRDRGQPGFASVKYETQFDGFSQGAMETFTWVVSDFDPATPIQVQAKAGRTVGAVTFTLGESTCDRTPPTPTPTALFSPLPTPTPDPSLTLDDYTFSEPRVVMTSPFASLAILDWLPDNRRAIIMPGESFEIQTLDVTTGVTVTYGNIGPTYPHAVWLEDAQKMAFLANRTAGQQLFLSTGSTLAPMQLGLHGFRSALASTDDRVIALEMGKEAPVLFDSEGNRLPVPPINVLQYGLNDPMAMFGTQMHWHPFEDKVAMLDIGGALIFDLLTGEVQYFDLNQNGIPTSETVFGPFMPMDVQWSPHGQKLAIELVRGQPIFGRSWLVILDRNSGLIENVPLPSLVLSDYAWAPNSRQLLLFGRDRIALRTWSTTAYLLDTQTGDFKTISQLSATAKGGYLGSGSAWSPDGHRLLYRCRLDDMPADLFAVCESTVTIGGQQ